MHINKLIQPSVGADLSALIGINLSDLTMSSWAQRRIWFDGAARCFAEFTLSEANGLSMTELHLYCHPERSEGSGKARGFPRWSALVAQHRLIRGLGWCLLPPIMKI